MMSFHKHLHSLVEQGIFSTKIEKIVLGFYSGYVKTLQEHHIDTASCDAIFNTYLTLIQEQLTDPFLFAPYHQMVVAPFDYYTFGLDFIRPLIDMKNSSLRGEKNILSIEEKLKKGENVILLANHQIEADPQAISILLEKNHAQLGKEMIFVAGERVLTDPLAAPFSMGRNLLCIYSKRYIDHPSDLKIQKQLHNKKTMELMSSLLSSGGKCIYVAPSGGRDRIGPSGTAEVAPFDAQSIEMFYLMAQKAKRETHFYPLALATFDLLPPPETVQIELGELRKTKHGAIHAWFADPLDMNLFPGSDLSDKHARRQARAEYICSLVKNAYAQLPQPGAQ